MPARARYLSAILSFCAAFAAFAAEDPRRLDKTSSGPVLAELGAADGAASAKGSHASPRVVSVISEIYAQLEKNYPQLINRLGKSDEDRIISAFVKSMGAGLEYRDPAAAESGSPVKDSANKSSRDVYPLVNIASNKLSYVRIDEFSPKSFERLKDDLEAAGRLPSPSKGIIIDLRNCAGFDYPVTFDSLKLFCAPERLPDARGSKDVKRAAESPSAILVGDRTMGAAEIFAYYMGRARQGLTIGGQTCGLPFPQQSILLSNGKALMIPDVPAEWDYYPEKPSAPSIKAEAYPQISYDKLSSDTGSEANDPCLSKAVDLLLSVSAIRQTPAARKAK